MKGRYKNELCIISLQDESFVGLDRDQGRAIDGQELLLLLSSQLLSLLKDKIEFCLSF